MADDISDEQLQRLPKYAQDYIKQLKRQRDTAVSRLKQFEDDQTPAPFYYQELEPQFKNVKNTSTFHRYI